MASNSPARSATVNADSGLFESDLPTARVSFRDSTGVKRSSPLHVTSEVATNQVDLTNHRYGIAYPSPGSKYQGFEILSELGRGAMGRVYLARQQAPAERVVVLKMGHLLSNECQKLAKLQHPNIVPVYSFHEFDGIQAVCMPYRGPLTLGHLVARLRNEQFQTLDGRSLTTMIEEVRKKRQPVIVTAERTLTPVPAATPEPSILEMLPNSSSFPGLKGLNYVDSILTMIQQVVEGLHVAHGERIVHSDLKPANVLISDDGCAQLIDFGVAFDRSELAREIGRLGGTRPYMSPEQLQSFLTQNLEHDERSDLYSVGVMLYELLTGRLPYDGDFEPAEIDIEQIRESRFQPPRSVASLNPRVPLAVESIIAKCLAPRADDRYQTAAELSEDLQRQVARRPLRFAPNLSQSELVGKWLSRNRVLLVATGLLTCTGVVAAAAWHRDTKRLEEIRRLEIVTSAEPFARDAEEAEFAFGLADRDAAYRKKGWVFAQRALARFGAETDPNWFEQERYQKLAPENRATYRKQVANLMLLMANAKAQEVTLNATAAATTKTELLAEATKWNRLATQTHPEGEGCRAVWFQRAYFARLGGNTPQADEYTKRAEKLPLQPEESVLEARQYVNEGRYTLAIKLLTDASAADPKLFWAAYYTGYSYQQLERYHDAVTAYDISSRLRPAFHGIAFHRGQCRLRLGQAAEAEVDFDAALRARPDWAEAYFYRSIAREAQTRFADAIDDSTHALAFGFSPTSIYFARSRQYGRLGDTKAAAADFAKGLETEPRDERGRLARAQAQLFRKPEAALTDYDLVLSENPRQVTALLGKAYILSDAGKNEEGIKVLTQLIEVSTDDANAYGGRGVLRARLDDREGALADARAALRITQSPAIRYQVAGIYAMTSRQTPADRREAYSLLDSALRDGYGFDQLADDRELDPIRNEPEFEQIVAAARKYRDSLKK